MKNIINTIQSTREIAVVIPSENYSLLGYADVYSAFRAVDDVTVNGQSVWVDSDSADYYTVPQLARELSRILARFDGAYLTRR
jgi:hypothetical protein|nr:MAG TPA: hypothetical protein [Caudoviricetes sp.]